MTQPISRPPLLLRSLPYLILLLALALFFAPVLFFSRVYFFRDLGMEIVPKRQFWADHHGLALWNPYVFAGEPFAANPQSSAFYPPSLLWLTGPAEVMLGPYLFFHFLLAGVFAYCLFLELGLRRESALAGALAFTLGGGYASLALQVVNLNSAAWIPGVFWLGLRSERQKSLRPVLALGVLIGLQILGGEPEICYLTLLALFAFFLARAVKAASASSTWSGLWRPWPRLSLAVLIGLGLSSAQWLLTLEMTKLSNRAAGYSLASAFEFSLDPYDLISILVPHYLLDPSSNIWSYGFWTMRLPYFFSIYPGVIAILLLPLAFRSQRRNQAIFWAGLALVSLLLALGPAGHLYPLAHRWLPGFNLFRFPERALLGFALAMAWLTALGLESLPHHFQQAKLTRPLRVITALLGLMAIVLIFLALRPLVPTADPQAYLFARSALKSLLFVALLLLALLIFSTSPRRRRFLPAAIIGLLVLDLFLTHYRLNPTEARSFYASTPDWVPELKTTNRSQPARAFIMLPPKIQDRVWARDQAPRPFYRRQRDLLQPFYALSFGINDLQAHSSFYLALTQEFNTLLYRSGQKEVDRLFTVCGVDKVAVPGKGVWPQSALPRAYLAFAERRVESHAQALESLLSSEFDPWKSVLLEGETSAQTLTQDRPIRPVEIKSYLNEQVELLVEAEEPAWLVLLDTYYPGWNAWVDDQPTPVRQANGFFRAVKVPAGRHQVRLVYRPTLWSLALGMTAGTALVVVLLWLRPLINRVSRKGDRR